jgi:hypothetical protein
MKVVLCRYKMISIKRKGLLLMNSNDLIWKLISDKRLLTYLLLLGKKLKYLLMKLICIDLDLIVIEVYTSFRWYQKIITIKIFLLRNKALLFSIYVITKILCYLS